MKSTKKSFAISALSLIMCVAMLLGTTYAWFTDSVTSGRNKIIAGNLDIELVSAKKGTVSTTTVLFDGVSKWEPGAAAYDTLTVKNVGSLALKYQLNLIFDNETKVDGHGLSEVLKIGTYAGSITNETKRETVIDAVTDWAPLASFSKSGNLPANTDDAAVTYVIYWQPGDNDNFYNMNNGNKGKELSIDFGVELVATQDTVESDSFDKNYDIEAPWLGGVGELPEAKDGVIEIASAEQLAALSTATASTLQNKTVKLVKDIDLNNVAWKPVSVHTSWTFDGNSHTILNLNVASNQRGNGLFSWCPGLTVKNLTVDGAKISGTGMDGVIVGNGSCVKVDKCTVKNAEVISNPNIKDENGDYNGDKSGIIVGYLCADGGPATVTNCVVEDSKITGYRQCGGIVGVLNGANASATGNKAKNVDITIDASNNYKGFEKQADFNVNGAIGQVLSGSASNNTATEGIKITLVYADGLIAVSDYNFEISTANGLKAFAKLATEAKDPGYPNQKTINAKVTDNLDATGIDWKNVVLEPKSRVSVHIDGNSKSISNINVTDEGKVALFASAGSDKNSGATMTIKDFTVKDSAFVSTKYVEANDGTAAFIGNLAGECSMTNCTVKDCVLTTQKYAGGFVGYDAHGSSTPVFTNCTVDGLTLTSTATSGSTSMGGFLGYSQSGYEIKGLDVKNVTNNGANGATVYYGLYFGTPNATMTLTDCNQSSGLAGRFDTNLH